MAKKSGMSVQKRQRERRKAEKAALKRARRQGKLKEGVGEPQPTVRLTDLRKGTDDPDESEASDPGHSADGSTEEKEPS